MRYNRGVIETTRLLASEQWAMEPAPDPAPLLEQVATLRHENVVVRAENAGQHGRPLVDLRVATNEAALHGLVTPPLLPTRLAQLNSCVYPTPRQALRGPFARSRRLTGRLRWLAPHPAPYGAA